MVEKREKFFVVLDNTEIVHRTKIDLNNEVYRKLKGITCSESSLRRWSNRISNIPLNASLEDISAAMEKDGWVLFQRVFPTILPMIICSPNGSRCNICSLTIPDGDCMCGNGHEPGKHYPIFKKI